MNEERKYDYNRGGKNLNYDEGFQIEKTQFFKHKDILKEVLNASEIELITRGILDKMTGTDAIVSIDDNCYPISLRYRNKDYNSFTLNRNIEDPYSEIHKWLKPNNIRAIKPLYHIQISQVDENTYKIIKVNIDAFKYRLENLIENGTLKYLYNAELQAYEFSLTLSEHLGGVYTTVYKI